MSQSTCTRVGLSTESDDLELFGALQEAQGAERDRIQELLVRRYAHLAGWLVSLYAGRAVDTEELRAVANVGLVLAIQRFDPDRGFEFPAFARPTIQGELRRYFRDKRRWVRLPRRIQETKAVIREATDDLMHELHRSPTVDELAARLAVDPELVLEALTADDAFSPTSLDAPVSLEGDGGYSVTETLGEVDPRFDLFVDCETVGPLIAKLPERDQLILKMRFFDDLTQAQIGNELGISQMHVSRLLSRTLVRLREEMLRD